MAKNKSNIPISNSTPKNIQIVSRRPGIHDHDEDSPGVYQLSPIPKVKQRKERLYNSDDPDGLEHLSSDSEDDPNQDDISPNLSINETFENCTETSYSESSKLNCNKPPPPETSSTSSVGNILCDNKITFTILFGIFAFALALSPSLPTAKEVALDTRLTIKDLQKKYPSQPKDIWDSLSYSVMESNERHTPSTFLLLYDNSSNKTTFQLVKDMASYSVCVLNRDCSYEPIVLNGYKVNRAVNDIDLISQYMPELKEKLVMIMLDIDGLSGLQAQSFHFMCDEHSPMAFKSVYFFTVNVEGVNTLSKTDWSVVEGILRKHWMDLDDDKLFPLLARITNILIKVVPEDHL